jgi:hypothetical protein
VVFACRRAGSPGHHHGAGAEVSRGWSRRLGDCDGLEVRHPRARGGGGLVLISQGISPDRLGLPRRDGRTTADPREIWREFCAVIPDAGRTCATHRAAGCLTGPAQLRSLGG